MISTFSALRSLIKPKKIHNDFPLFRLHHQVTVLFLLTFCLIVSAKLMFGDAIDCISNSDAVPALDAYCWSKGTYTIHDVVHRDGKHPFYSHPGMPGGTNRDRIKATVRRHSYYPYVHIILFFQAVLFYAPHYLWKIWENGSIVEVCQQIQNHRLSPKSYLDANRHLLTYLRQCLNTNRTLALRYYFCNILMFINVIVQIIWINWIINGEFYTYGYNSILYSLFDEDIYPEQNATGGRGTKAIGNPLDNVFPKFTICEYLVGSIRDPTEPDRSTVLCILPFQILHDKIYLFLWFWLLILAVVTSIHLIYSIFYITFPFLRSFEFERRFKALIQPGHWDSSSLNELFILHMIGDNIDPLVFKMVLEEMDTMNCKSSEEAV